LNELTKAFWDHALKAMQTAERDFSLDTDASASRSYYAAFYAVSALFLLENKKFSKHSAIEVAVHRDLVKTGRWPEKGGSDFSFLRRTRVRSDYEAIEDISEDNAREALAAARRILERVHSAHPDLFPFPSENP